jgi:hypothetical protein
MPSLSERPRGRCVPGQRNLREGVGRAVRWGITGAWRGNSWAKRAGDEGVIAWCVGAREPGRRCDLRVARIARGGHTAGVAPIGTTTAFARAFARPRSGAGARCASVGWRRTEPRPAARAGLPKGRACGRGRRASLRGVLSYGTPRTRLSPRRGGRQVVQRPATLGHTMAEQADAAPEHPPKPESRTTVRGVGSPAPSAPAQMTPSLAVSLTETIAVTPSAVPSSSGLSDAYGYLRREATHQHVSTARAPHRTVAVRTRLGQCCVSGQVPNRN